MPSLQEDFNELMERVKRGRELGHASFEPIYYLVFKPRQILEVKRQTVAWLASLRNDGCDAHRFSIADEIAQILEQAPLRRYWLTADKASPLEWGKTNASLSQAVSNGALQRRLQAKLEEMEAKRNPILLVTDLEALHPFVRIGAVESQLYGKFKTPTVFLYPGERTGKTRLRFLGFYPEDGNYRSVPVGG
jgi:hypothetical protein